MAERRPEKEHGTFQIVNVGPDGFGERQLNVLGVASGLF